MTSTLVRERVIRASSGASNRQLSIAEPVAARKRLARQMRQVQASGHPRSAMTIPVKPARSTAVTIPGFVRRMKAANSSSTGCLTSGYFLSIRASMATLLLLHPPKCSL
jgi:hypothetical protein